MIGDPQRLPHPIVWFGKTIAFFEHRLNKGQHRLLKGALMSVSLIALTYAITWWLHSCFACGQQALAEFLGLSTSVHLLPIIFDAIIVFYCLAGTTLIREVRQVFLALERSLEEGRAQVARIVGRDTSELSAQ